MDDLIVIQLFILICIVYMEQLINDIRKLLWHFLSYLGTCIFRRHLTADLDQPVNGYLLPVFRITPHFHHPRQMAFRIVDQIR